MQSVQQVTVVAYVIFMITIIIILGRYYSLYKVWIEISVFDFNHIMYKNRHVVLWVFKNTRKISSNHINLEKM